MPLVHFLDVLLVFRFLHPQTWADPAASLSGVPTPSPRTTSLYLLWMVFLWTTPTTVQLELITGGGGTDYGNLLNDLNPDEIQEISVLKGPAARALWFTRCQRCNSYYHQEVQRRAVKMFPLNSIQILELTRFRPFLFCRINMAVVLLLLMKMVVSTVLSRCKYKWHQFAGSPVCSR